MNYWIFVTKFYEFFKIMQLIFILKLIINLKQNLITYTNNTLNTLKKNI